MNFIPVRISSYCSTIEYKFQISYLRNTNLINVLIISIEGKYRNGSAGSPDAGYIRGIIKMGVEVFDPFFVIIDFSNLEYNWGDDFDLSFSETGNIKTSVVVGSKCRYAMSTLNFGLNTNKDIVDNDFFFESLQDALEKINT